MQQLTHTLQIPKVYPGRTLRFERVCLACTRARPTEGPHVEDELHLLLECPSYQATRLKYIELLPFASGTMEAMMTCPNQKALAYCVYDLYEKHVAVHN